jgi:prepilin-type N-terminal cleavage/methylation domain-containing protein
MKRINIGWRLSRLRERYLSKSCLKLKSGFTLIELIAALAILTIALLPLLNWLPLTIQTQLKAEHKTKAIFLAQGKLEELRTAISNNFDQDYNVLNPLAFNPPYQNFRYSITDDLDTSLKTISVKAWYIENPQDETIFYSQIARR